MQEYKEKFFWNKIIEKMKKDMKDKINKEINEMIIDSSDEDNIGANNNNEMPNYNPLYNDNFFDDNDMILDD